MLGKENEKMMYELAKQSEKYQITKCVELNEKTKKYGLVLTEEEAKEIVLACKSSLKTEERIEFGESIVPKIIFSFCDSSYIMQDDYVATIEKLVEIFYLYKNETNDMLTDDELVDMMRDFFEGECQGSLEFLEETVLMDVSRRLKHIGDYCAKRI